MSQFEKIPFGISSHHTLRYDDKKILFEPLYSGNKSQLNDERTQEPESPIGIESMTIFTIYTIFDTYKYLPYTSTDSICI